MDSARRRSWLVAFLTLIVAFVGSSIANAQRSPGRVVIGQTIGDVSASSQGGDLGKAIQIAAFQLTPFGGGTIEVGPGNYSALSSAMIYGMRVSIEISPAAYITIDHSGPVGLLSLANCDNCTVEGGRIITRMPVANQRLIEVTNSRFTTIERVVAEYNTQPAGQSGSALGDEANPMVAFYFSNCVAKTLRGVTVLPNYAVTCVKSLNGNGLSVLDSFFQNTADAGIGPGDYELAIPRLCYRVIDVDGDEWGQISRNKVWGLGDSTGLGLGLGISWVDNGLARLQWNNTTSTGPGGTDAPEQGHWIISNNIVEMTAYKVCVHILGMPSINLMGNLFGFNWNYQDDLGEASIIVDDSNGATVGGNAVSDFQAIGNDFHNLAATGVADDDGGGPNTDHSGAFMYIRGCDSFAVLSTTFAVVNSQYAIEVASASVKSGKVIGCTFRSTNTGASATASAFAIHLNSGGGLTDGFVAAANTVQGFWSSGGCVKNDSGVTSKIFTTGLMNASTEQPYVNTVISIPATGATVVSSNAIITRSSGNFTTDGWQVGDLLTTIGLDATAENGRVYAVAAVGTTTITLSGTPLTNDTDGDAGANLTLVKVGGNPTANLILLEDT